MPTTIFNLVSFGWTKVASAGQVVSLRNLSDYNVEFKISNLIPNITTRDSVLFVNESINLNLSEDLYVLGLSGNTASVSVTVVVPSLSALSLSSSVASVGATYSGTIFGQTFGSTITATSSDGTLLVVSGSTVTGTFTSSGSPTITLVETLAGATGSPETSTLTITVVIGGTADFSQASNSNLIAAIAA